MILRSLSSSLRKQDWATVLIEIVIVVVGVFIGIQVSNWNDERKSAIADQVLLKRIGEEFKILEPELQRISGQMRETVDATGKVILALRKDEPPDDDKAFRDLLAQANFVRRLPGLSATYRELLATRGISSIKSADLRLALTSYGNFYAQADREYENAYATVYHPQAIYFDAVQWSVDPTQWNSDNAVLSYNWEQLRGAGGELQTWLVYQVDLMQYAESQLVEARKILSLLKERKP